MSLLEPHFLASVRDLNLLARKIVRNVWTGVQRSNRNGSEIEFSQYRAYQAGDDLRQLDWKLFARTDRLYIRQSETETATTIQIWLDATASMRHQDGVWQKFDYARKLAACLAYLAVVQQDVFSVQILHHEQVISFPFGKKISDFNRLIEVLEKIEPQGKMPFLLENQMQKPQYGTHEINILLTDGYAQGGELDSLLALLSHPRKELHFWQILGKNEIECDFGSGAVLEDLETGEKVRLDSKIVKENYLLERKKWQAELENKWNMDFQVLSLETPFEECLKRYLVQK